MDIRKYITKKNVIIGAVAGTAVIGGIVALIVRHHKKKEIDEFLREEEDFDLDYFGDEFWDEDLDDDDEVEDVASTQLAERVTQYHDAAEKLLKELEKYDSRDVYVCGGESVYKELLPYCDTAHVTRVDHSYAADTYFPDLDKSDEWEIAVESDEEVYFDVTYTFVKYVRK